VWWWSGGLLHLVSKHGGSVRWWRLSAFRCVFLRGELVGTPGQKPLPLASGGPSGLIRLAPGWRGVAAAIVQLLC